jgi:bifunctional UDP-N-acetylglucosamine pyrophosphorylase/glucosamine-1-phosphate N-acetyltransferase
MKALILAAGRGANLGPLTMRRPTAMLPVCGEPILARQLRMLREVGLSEATIVVGHRAEALMGYFKDGAELGIALGYARQERAVGVGDAVLAGREHFAPTSHFLLLYGDIIVAENLVADLLTSFNSLRAPVASVALTASTRRYGNIYMDSSMRIHKVLEKPGSKAMGNYVLAGAYVLPGAFFRLLADHDGDFLAALERLIADQGLYASIWEGDWMDLDRPWDLLAANRMIMETWDRAVVAQSVVLEGTAQVRGPARIEAGVRIMSGAVVRGPCYIARNCYIGNNALVRGFSAIGEECVVGFGVEVKDSVLMRGTKIGRLSFIGDSVLCEQVDVGAGTMTVNNRFDRGRVTVEIAGETVDTGLHKLGAMVGDEARIGAGNILLPGTRIDAGMELPHRAASGIPERE